MDYADFYLRAPMDGSMHSSFVIIVTVLFYVFLARGALIYQSDVQVPPSTSDMGVFRWQEQPKKKGSFGDRSKIMGSFSESVVKRGGI